MYYPHDLKLYYDYHHFTLLLGTGAWIRFESYLFDQNHIGQILVGGFELYKFQNNITKGQVVQQIYLVIRGLDIDIEKLILLA